MVTLVASPETPESVRKAIELLNRDLQEHFPHWNTREQAQFWEQLHGYALAQVRQKDRRVPLVIAPEVHANLRRGLELVENRIALHLRDLDPERRQRFWSVLHHNCEEQLQASPEETARRSGGGSGA